MKALPGKIAAALFSSENRASYRSFLAFVVATACLGVAWIDEYTWAAITATMIGKEAIDKIAGALRGRGGE